jgi:hypothetical protein
LSPFKFRLFLAKLNLDIATLFIVPNNVQSYRKKKQKRKKAFFPALSALPRAVLQGCQILLGPNISKRKKYTK